MAVYVDNAFIVAKVRSGRLTHESRWCHMTADTTEELIAFAVSLGLQEKYIQYRGTWKEHFDVTEPKRRLAVSKGAIEVDYRIRVMEMAAAKKSAKEIPTKSQDELPF